MIRERLLAVREKRAALISQAGRQREDLHLLVRRADAATAWMERGYALFLRIKARPAWIAAGVALLLIVRPRKTLRWLATAASLWRTWKSARAWAERMSAPARRGAL